MNLKLTSLMIVVTCSVSQVVIADEEDDYETFVYDLCFNTSGADKLAANWTVQQTVDFDNNVCGVAFPPALVFSSSDYTSSSNTGGAGSQSRSSNNVASGQAGSIKERLNDLYEEEGDEGSWGVLFAPQLGRSSRDNTVNENGFDSDLAGVSLGADYRFSDNFVLGSALSVVSDEAAFDGGSGVLQTDSASLTLYTTWSPTDNSYVDGYVGFSNVDLKNSRVISFQGSSAVTVSFGGTTTSSFSAAQTLMGVSSGYDWQLDDVTLGGFVGFDYIRTVVDAYTEAGTTLLELRFPEQITYSSLLSLGGRVSTTMSERWGYLVPNASLVAVREYRDDGRTITSELSNFPTASFTQFQVTTDAPDRNYLLLGFGVSAALNSGTQLFAQYEQRLAHDYLDTWSLSLGVLAEY